MRSLQNLLNTHRPHKVRKRVGRGIGSGTGRTCGRGEKGAGSRSGYRRRDRYEGGQMPLYRKLPVRGFSNARFQVRFDCVNLHQLELIFSDGDLVNIESLRKHGFLGNSSNELKILGEGELTKKVRIEAHAFSKSAQEKLQNSSIEFVIIQS